MTSSTCRSAHFYQDGSASCLHQSFDTTTAEGLEEIVHHGVRTAYLVNPLAFKPSALLRLLDYFTLTKLPHVGAGLRTGSVR